MRGAVLSALLSHWRRRPLQLATLILGLALATALWTGVQAINAEARASYAEASEALGAGGGRIVGTGPIPPETWVAMRRAGWPVTPVVEGEIAEGVRLVGIDGLTAGGAGPFAGGGEAGGRAGEGAATEAEDGVDPLAFLRGEAALVSPEAVAALGRRAVLGGREVALVPSAAAGTGEVVADWTLALDALGREGFDRLDLSPAGPEPLTPLPRGLRVVSDGGDVARLTDSFHLNLTAFGLLSFAVGLFIVQSSVALAFEQRRPAFRTLRALGVPGGTLVALAAGELVVLSLVAGAAGVLLGWAVAAALLPGVAATLEGLYGAEVDGGLSLRPAWALSGLGIAVAGALLASVSALWKLWRLPPLAAGQPRAWARASGRTALWQGAAAAGLLALSAAVAWAADGLVAGFVTLGALLLGAALALPPVLSLTLAWGARLVRGPQAEWFMADTRQQLPGLSLALMALLLALAANVGVSTMVGSFRGTFTGWLDQRLAAELYITAGDPAQAEEIEAFLAPRAEAILPIWSVPTRIGGVPGEIYGVRDHATYRDNWPLLEAAPDVWDRLQRGEVLINEQTARRMSLGVGDAVALAEGWEARVAGVYSDYGNPAAQAMAGEADLARRYPDAPVFRFGLRTGDPEGLRAALIEFGLPPEAVIDQAGIKAFSLEVFDRTFAVTAALNVLTLSVAGFAMLASLLTLAAMRLPQLAPVWALGVTRRRLGWLELLRSVMLAGITAVLALPVGLALAWVLLAVVNVEAFGWRLPMRVFPGDWMVLGGAALLAAALAAAWPARRLATLPPRALIAVFVQER
ncbi:putative ABC transport system permease protein [Hasllibacter halocynthiae]|uniref:Putative ABC transport system permease protein n=1 Tax=Hasllibacter halocynthiae TaxID=595589 RepID=A0A2T0X953_9RHOB|nr:ABC transporter permease [Hasllibacter halocynthiae]PRY95478.1 putative ABC transport system permease protein [Hasllibacter halocynthiae]